MFALVDLANTTVFRGVHRPNQAVVGARLDRFINRISECLETQGGDDPLDLVVRLYDGWFDGLGAETELYGIIRGHIRQAYPTRRRRVRLKVEIADAMIASPEHRLVDTTRWRRGLDRYPVTVQHAPIVGCGSPESCSLEHLRAWFAGFCHHRPQCHVAAEDVASYRFQKLVDTSIVADAIWLGTRTERVAVVTDDDDVVPGLVTASCAGADILWLGQEPVPQDNYRGILSSLHIEYLQC